MNTKRPLHILLAIAIAFTSWIPASASEALKTDAKKRRPKVQIAILLDNSGSMSGLINQARSELWKIVNEFATAKQDDASPLLEVALYHYGSPPATQLVPLTDDLDKVSEALFGINISGGKEYCGQVIDMSAKNLAWSESERDLKLIFIAGNEPFSQGPVDYRQACKYAIEKGIIVNTIHCGNGIPDGWKNAATLADGKSININQNQAVVNIPAPQDKKIAELGIELNKTYVAYGARGVESKLRQEKQDSNAAGASPSAARQRAFSKSLALYRNSSWDICDACKEGTIDLANIEVEKLPENMRTMSVEERKAYVKKLQEERTTIQEQIKSLNSEREKFVAKKRKEMANAASEKTLDVALIEAIRAQATAKDFTFDK